MSAFEDAGLYAHSICNVFDVEALRKIRNECRLFMTGDIKPITEEAQSAWYDTYVDYGPRRIEVWLILRRDINRPIGFLSLRYYHETTPHGSPHTTWDRGRSNGGRNKAIITLGLLEEHRNRGYGTAIYRYAREIPGCEIEATIQATNVRSIRAAEKAGYVRVAATPENVYMCADPLGGEL